MRKIDQLEYMSLEAGRSYNESLMPFCTGNTQSDRSIPVQWMMYELWEEMRTFDRQLANEVVEPVFVFMRAQTSKERLLINDLHHYFQYRQDDVGQAYVIPSKFFFSYLLTTKAIGCAHTLHIRPSPFASRACIRVRH
jgi:aristolochene synthase